ncbi:MAG TPA: hypothetical protein VFU88_12415 [Ktedonobacterales bacterium]|nr:hypothetical protein [Ktedonobacterales bacterium]
MLIISPSSPACTVRETIQGIEDVVRISQPAEVIQVVGSDLDDVVRDGDDLLESGVEQQHDP